jgi:hypothetical protein
MGGRSVVGVGVGAHQAISAISGRVGVGVGSGETGSMVGVRPGETGVRPSKASTGSVVSVTSRQARTRRMPKPSSRMGSSVSSPMARVGMLSSSYPSTNKKRRSRSRSDQPFTILPR